MPKIKKRIYLDYAAATPIDKRVANVMKKSESLAWANVSSLYQEGERAKKILEEARTKIAAILRCRCAEIYFTSGGTEAGNLAVLGILSRRQGVGTPTKASEKNAHVITSSIEHPSILEAVKSSGNAISIVNPSKNGIIDPKSIEKEIRKNTILICLMHANNEIGTIQPVKEVAKIIENYKLKIENSSRIALLVDASQSALYEDVSPERLSADLLILDGIKMYGPRGAGILFVKHGVEISPTMFGGGQERGLRPGTENAIAAIGLAEALQIAVEKREAESKRLAKLRDYAISKILSEIPNSSLNGDQKRRLPNNINICFEFKGLPLKNLDPKGSPWEKIDSEFLVIKLDTLGFSVSAASACSNLNVDNPSYVIESLYKSPSTSSGSSNCGRSSLRFTLGRSTTKSDLDKLIFALKKILK